MKAYRGIYLFIYFGNRNNSKQNISGNALAGMTVRHDLENFTEGKDVILTLDDAKILDEGNEHQQIFFQLRPFLDKVFSFLECLV